MKKQWLRSGLYRSTTASQCSAQDELQILTFGISSKRRTWLMCKHCSALCDISCVQGNRRAIYFCITSSLQRGGCDLRAVITCCQDYLTWVIVTLSRDGVRAVQTQEKQWLKNKEKVKLAYPHIPRSQMENKSDVLISIFFILPRDWLSELAFGPPGSLWLARIHRFSRWLSPFSEAKALPLMARFHSNCAGGSGAGETHRSHFLINWVLLSLGLFSPVWNVNMP